MTLIALAVSWRLGLGLVRSISLSSIRSVLQTSVGRGLTCSCAQGWSSSDLVVVVVLRDADLCCRTG